MKLEKFGPADFREQPWKNGGGTTLELLRGPHPRAPEKFAWRVSSATVATSGPFSVFPGIDRILLLLEGDGLALRCGDAPEVVLTDPGAPFHFRGDVPTHCRLLGGPVRDFNLMVDRTLFRGAVSVVRPDQPAETRACTPLCLVSVLEGLADLSVPGSGQTLRLAKGELGRVGGARSLHLAPAGADFRAVRVDLSPTAREHDSRIPGASVRKEAPFPTVFRPATREDLAIALSWTPHDDEALRRWAGPLTRCPATLESLWEDITRADSAPFSLEAPAHGLVGFGQVRWRDQSYGHLARIIVSPRHRGLGLGRTLCTALMREGARLHPTIKGFSLYVFPENFNAIGLYRSIGYTERGLHPEFNCVLMEAARSVLPSADRDP